MHKLVFMGDSARDLPDAIWADRLVHETGIEGLHALVAAGEAPLVPLLSLPFAWVWGHPAWWLPFLGVGLLLNGCAAAWLAGLLGHGRAGRFLCGVAFALTPATLLAVDAGRQGLVWVCAVPLAWAWAHRAWQTGTARAGWAAGLWLAVCGLGDPALGLAAWVGVLALRRGHEAQPQLGRMIRGWLVCVPFALPALIEGLPLADLVDALAVVAGLGLAISLPAWPRMGWAVAIALAVAVGPPTVSTVYPPPVYGLLPAGSGAWIELPIAATQSHRIFGHGHRILEAPWLVEALPQAWPADAGLPAPLEAALDQGLTHVIVHTSLFGADGVEREKEMKRLAWLDATCGPPIVSTAEARVYRVRSAQGSNARPSSPQSM